MQILTIFLSLFLVACSERSQSTSAPALASAGTTVEPAAPLPPPPATPRADYAQVAEEACGLAGGACIPVGDCLPDGVVIEGLACRPGIPGIHCCRKQGPCEGFGRAECCAESDGKVVSTGRAGCDRGHLSCVGRAHAWLASDGKCGDTPSQRVAGPSEHEASKWPRAHSVASAGAWSCQQVGGVELAPGRACDGFRVALSATGSCCLPSALCVEEHAGTECCEPSGQVRVKECADGKAFCHPALLGSGTAREVPRGTCQPYEI